MASITSLRLGEWKFRWVDMRWPYAGAEGQPFFSFVACGVEPVSWNICKTKALEWLTVVFRVGGVFWIWASSHSNKILLTGMLQDSTATPATVECINVLVDPRIMLGFGMLIMMIAATSGQTAFQQWPVWVEMLWWWTATGRDLIKIMDDYGSFWSRVEVFPSIQDHIGNKWHLAAAHVGYKYITKKCVHKSCSAQESDRGSFMAYKQSILWKIKSIGVAMVERYISTRTSYPISILIIGNEAWPQRIRTSRFHFRNPSIEVSFV